MSRNTRPVTLPGQGTDPDTPYLGGGPRQEDAPNLGGMGRIMEPSARPHARDSRCDTGAIGRATGSKSVAGSPIDGFAQQVHLPKVAGVIPRSCE